MRKWTWSLAGLSLAALLGLAGLGLAALLAYSSIELARFERAEARSTTYVYAAGQPLALGVHVRLADLAGTLGRLTYTETRTPPTAPGQFQRAAGAWEIFLRGGERGGRGAHRVRLEVSDERIRRVVEDGQSVDGALLEPEILTGVAERPGEEFRPIRLAEAPLTLMMAVLAAEDQRFFDHAGVDLRGLVRAAWTNLRAGRVKQGGSTITQQLIKVRLLSPKRTFLRKLDEAWLATLVEWRYSKPQILEAYLNGIYLGQRGPLAIRGVGAAARAYFGKEVHGLTLGEAALLAGMVRAPNSYSPAVNPDRARERRDVVLGRMRELGKITDADYQKATREPIRVPATAHGGQLAPYFTDYVRQELEASFGEDALHAIPGAHVFTTLDLALQRFGEAALARGLDRLESRVPALRRADPAARLQAALIAFDPATGHIRALVGGRDYQISQFNRAALARRQPGSAFKPFVFLTALRGVRGDRPLFTAASLVEDSPVSLMVNGREWTPRNYEGRYEGRVTVRRALEQSLNSATVRLAQAVGLPAVVETARTLGLAGPLQPVPAMALGAFEVTPVALARAYLPFANGGLRPAAPATIRGVYDRDGERLDDASDEATAVISPAEAYLMTSLLQGVIRSGTGASARALGVPDGVAGKTGTTNDGRDAWFVGYSSRLLTVVWVGFDASETHGMSGAQAALPIWADFMKQALDLYPPPAFSVPAGISVADIDTTNGKLATRFCPLVARETFLTGTEPAPCDEHGGVTDQITDWWKRFRDWIQR